MSNNLKQIFFIFVRQKEIVYIKIKDIENFNKNLKEIKKLDSFEIDKKTADLYSIDFINLTKFNKFCLVFLNRKNQKLYTSEDIKFKNDIDNFIYDFKINEDTGLMTKVVTIGFYNKKEYDYIKLNKSQYFSIFINYIHKTYEKVISPGNHKDNLITQTINVIAKEKDKVSFALYLTIFKEIFRFNKIATLLRIFKIEKLSFDEKIDPNKFTKLFKLNLKNPNYFDQFFEKNDKSKKNCINNYYLIILLYFSYYEVEYISELLFPEKYLKVSDQDLIKKMNIRANQMKELLTQYSNYFPKLPSNLNILSNKENIPKISTLDELINYLEKKIKLEDKLKIISEKINNIHFWKNVSIKSYNTEISKDDNINNIIKLFESIINLGRAKRVFLIEMDADIWQKYVGFYVQAKNIDNIYKIKECVIQAGYNYYLINHINSELFNLGIKMVKEKLLKNEGTIKFLINYCKNNNQYLHPYNFLFLADGIFINEANDIFFNEYKSFNMKQFYGMYYIKFVEKIILNINKIDDFIFVFKIFPPIKNNQYERNIIDTIIKCLWQIIEKEENIENSEKFNEIMMNIINIYINNHYKYEDFLNQLNTKGIKKEIIKKLYLWIILYYGQENKDFVNYAVNFLSSDKTDTNIEDTINLLNQLKNNDEALFLYFNNKNIIQKVIKETDFKKPSITQNFKFLSLLVENLFFEDTMKNKLIKAGYYHLTISFVNKILDKYKSLDFDYNEALELDKIKDNLLEKLNVICFNDFNLANEIFGKIENTIENFIELKANTEIIEKYINKFFKKDKKINKLISSFNSNLTKCKIAEYEKYLTEYNSKYKEHLENAKKCNKLNQSIFFSNLYKYYEKENPNETDKYLLDKTINNFEELSDILEENKLNNISKETFNIILENIKDEKEIRKEMNILKKHFGEEGKDTTNIEKKLLLLSQREFILFSISDILFFLEKLNVTQTGYTEQLKQINSSINTESSLTELLQVSNILSELDINIKLQHESLKILRILHNKSSLLEFLLDTEEDKKFNRICE